MHHSPRRDMTQVFLHDVKVALRVGYLASEKIAPQPLIISVELGMAALPDYTAIGDDLAQLFDYASLHHFLTVELPQRPHCAFLEEVAEHVLQFCWRDARVLHTRVRVQKPEIFPDAPNIGIVLQRRRPETSDAGGADRQTQIC